MGLQSCSLSELLTMDKTYASKIQIRRDVILNNEKDVVACNPVANDAVAELYEWIFGTYLPKRFPSAFVISEDPETSSSDKTIKNGSHLRNITTNELIPLRSPSSPTEALKTLGQHVDAEFALLLPTPHASARLARVLPTSSPPHPYHLHAWVLAFPSGFTTAAKHGRALAAIHAPVPGYGAKLARSMDRFFAALPFAAVARRQNWAVQSGDVLFRLAGNHLSTVAEEDGGEGLRMAPPEWEERPGMREEWERLGEGVDPAECRLRAERQTLHRLEKTGALVFAFKTYLYTLDEVIEEGIAEQMADAIEGLGKGSVPAIEVYKRAVVWSKKVVEYLRVGHQRREALRQRDG